MIKIAYIGDNKFLFLSGLSESFSMLTRERERTANFLISSFIKTESNLKFYFPNCWKQLGDATRINLKDYHLGGYKRSWISEAFLKSEVQWGGSVAELIVPIVRLVMDRFSVIIDVQNLYWIYWKNNLFDILLNQLKENKLAFPWNFRTGKVWFLCVDIKGLSW